MSSTISTEDFQSTLNQFEQMFGVPWNEFINFDLEAQRETFLNAQDDIDTDSAYSVFDDLYEYFYSLKSVYENMMNNGNSLERAQGEIYYNDILTDFNVVQNLSTTWGDSMRQTENDNQTSAGSDISYTLDSPYSGQEVTLDLSQGNPTDSNWISDPHANNPDMADTDGDGYKDTTFYVSSRDEYNVVNLEGNTVNIDTDGDGDIDQYDGLNANRTDIPTCMIDLNGGAWELVDYNPETQTYRLKITTGEEPDLVESYINVVGPCYIVPTDGTPPNEDTLRSYPEEAMRFFKESSTNDMTVGDLLYGAEAQIQNRTILMDSTTNNNEFHDTITEDMWESEAVVTVALEADQSDNFYLDAQNADASFEWEGNDLYIYFTNEEGQTVTYILKGFETSGMDDYSDQSIDALHLSNVDISDEEYEKLYYMSPGYGDSTDSRNDENLSAAYREWSMASYIFVNEETDEDNELVSMWDSESFELSDDE
jgi:hypothetical protein